MSESEKIRRILKRRRDNEKGGLYESNDVEPVTIRSSDVEVFVSLASTASRFHVDERCRGVKNISSESLRSVELSKLNGSYDSCDLCVERVEIEE